MVRVASGEVFHCSGFLLFRFPRSFFVPASLTELAAVFKRRGPPRYSGRRLYGRDPRPPLRFPPLVFFLLGEGQFVATQENVFSSRTVGLVWIESLKP